MLPCKRIGLLQVLLLLFLVSIGLHSYRVHQMRICIQSMDPSRLPSQCIYCKTRIFALTVRLCTANTYLPARMNLNEAYCLTNACRRQLPRLPPEPYSPSGSGNGGGIASNAAIAGNQSPSINSEENSNNNNNNFNSMGNANVEPNGEENYEEAESLMAQQPTKVRPPAKFYLGQPQKYKNPIRPMIFG